MPEGDQRSGRLRVRISDERGRRARADGLGPWLARVAPARARGIVSVALVSDRRVRALNRSYRRQDHATDVLSFPAFARATHAHASARARLKPLALSPEPFLGDIVIARGVARRQAREARHSELTELKFWRSTACCTSSATITSGTTAGCCGSSAGCADKGGLREGLIERAQPRAPR